MGEKFEDIKYIRNRGKRSILKEDWTTESDILIRIGGLLTTSLFVTILPPDLILGTVTLSGLLLILFYSEPQEVRMLNFQNWVWVIYAIASYNLHRFWRLVSISFLNVCVPSHQGLASLLDRVRAPPQSWGGGQGCTFFRFFGFKWLEQEQLKVFERLRVEFKRLQGAAPKLFCLLLYRHQSTSLRRAWVTCRELAAEAGCPGGHLNFRSEESSLVGWVHRYQVRSPLRLCPCYLGHQLNLYQ